MVVKPGGRGEHSTSQAAGGEPTASAQRVPAECDAVEVEVVEQELFGPLLPMMEAKLRGDAELRAALHKRATRRLLLLEKRERSLRRADGVLSSFVRRRRAGSRSSTLSSTTSKSRRSSSRSGSRTRSARGAEGVEHSGRIEEGVEEGER